MPKFLLFFLTICAMYFCNNYFSDATSGSSGRPSSTRWRIMRKSVYSVMTNGVFLMLSGAPFTSLRSAHDHLKECVAHAYDEQVAACIEQPPHSVAAALLVLTDLQTWLWPPDHDVVNDVQVDVLIRRFRLPVREDMCPQADRPEQD